MTFDVKELPMNQGCFHFIKCLQCGRTGMAAHFFEGPGIIPDNLAYDKSIIAYDGILSCKCNNFYPIIGNIIRTIAIDTAYYNQFFIRHDKVLREMGLTFLPVRLGAKVCFAYDSFGYQWDKLRNDQNIWGISKDQMYENLEKQLLKKREALRNDVILDAGCGHGRVTDAFSRLSDNVVSLEISESINNAFVQCANKKNVLFIQADVMNPPFSIESFDVVYSAGVLHHTPNTKKAAQALMPLVKKTGRFYIWLYPKRSFLFMVTIKYIRFFTSRLPRNLLWTLLRLSIPLFNFWKLIKHENYFTAIREDEVLINLFDCYSPRYQHRHTPLEITAWFKEKGFTETSLLHFNKDNLDMIAIKGNSHDGVSFSS